MMTLCMPDASCGILQSLGSARGGLLPQLGDAATPTAGRNFGSILTWLSEDAFSKSGRTSKLVRSLSNIRDL